MGETRRIAFPNNSTAAHAVYEAAKGTGRAAGSLTLRPFNRFELPFTEWWMIPSTEWPAYQHGKLCFWRFPTEPSAPVYVGYCVEKGLTRAVEGMADVPPSHIMQPNWYWHTFLDQMPGEAFRSAIVATQNSVGSPLRLVLMAYAFNRVPREDESRVLPDDFLEFEFNSDGMGINLYQSADSYLEPLNQARDLESSVKILRGLDLRFHWVDLIMGIPFEYGQPEGSGWGSEELWLSALAPWLPWVR